MLWGNFRGWWRLAAMLVSGAFAFAPWATASEQGLSSRDTLVFKDGDRIQGKLVDNADGTIVFQSERFGSLRVPAADAVVIKAEAQPAATRPAPVAAATPEAVAAEEKEAQRVSIWDQFSSGVLTARVREFFGPWHGRLAFSTEVVSDSADRNNHSFEAKLTRKWARDEAQVTARYDSARANDVLTTDLLKASGSWRHEFERRHFLQYRPSVEWDRASKKKGGPTEYILLQQELGIGYNLLSSPARKVRLGVSHNAFDLWSLEPTADHTTHNVPSAFEELELRLPWRMGLTQRGVWYPSGDGAQGWENRIELNKKLTETLTTSVRHEIRRDHPDGSVPDYTRLKLLFGFDF
jgi:hypothetical protein